MDLILRDFRYAARQLLRAPGFAVVAILTLALGIGANTAIFSLLDQVLLRNLPARDPDRLVILKFNGIDGGGLRSRMSGQYYFSEPMYRELAKRAAPLSGLLARAPYHVAVNWQGQTEQVDSEMVSGNYFDVLGVRPAAGRLLQAADDQQINGSPVVVLSYEFWQQRFGGRSGVVGQTLVVNSHPFTIVGVAAPGFRSAVVGEAPAVFVPIMMEEQAMPGSKEIGDWRSRWLNLLGRVKDGVTREQAQAQLDPVWHALRQDDMKRMLATHHGVPPHQRGDFLASPLFLEPGTRGLSPLRDDLAAPLTILMIMVGLVLLIACANVATLLLARGAARQREIAICFALGAQRLRVMRQLLAEALLVGLPGGAVGLLVAPWALELLLNSLPAQADIIGALSTDIDSRLLMFTFGVAVLTSVLAGIAPALRFSKPNVALTLTENSGSVAGFRSKMRHVLVGGQIAVSVVLLVAAGLFTRTLLSLGKVEVGFATEHVVTFDVNPMLNGYEDTRDVNRRIMSALQGLPGTEAVAGSSVGLLDHDTNGDNVTVDSYKAAPEEILGTQYASVTPGYFHAMQTPLIAGRDFSESDAEGATKVCIVNEDFAKKYLGGAQQAVGHWIAFGYGDGVKPDIQIIGVAHNSKYAEVREVPPRFVYLPYFQKKQRSPMTFYVRTAAPPDQAAAAIRRAVAGVDANLPVLYLETMQEHVKTSLFLERVVAELSLTFGLLAAALASVGLYGMLAFAVGQRKREIGIRMALGATTQGIVRLVLVDVARLVVAAIAVGLPVALVLTSALRSQLYGISSRDPLTYVLVVIVVSAVALLAAALPARRAARLDPLQALRAE